MLWRGLLRCRGALALAVFLSACFCPPSTSQRVAVVGGGIGGASFAWYYKKAHPLAEVILLEASNRLGGRLRHVVMHNETIEMGKQSFAELMVCPTADRTAGGVGFGDWLAG